MKIRTIATAGALTVGVAVIGVLGAGTASAATPIVDPEFGVAGVLLTNAETAALAASPIPDALASLVPNNQRIAYLEEGSVLLGPDGTLTGPDKVMVGEAAARGGHVNVYLTDPNNPRNEGFIVQYFQHWN
ncbi:hypothetical protein ACJEDT_02885 [Rhodococcoides fascians]|mgnify:CR=1 FL=1|uniref:hypothetical protein n=1 Tax=Nocardiaceae TaxID=85025 RepID=UPI00050D0538|nr:MULTISPECIES: hypothetical protein [Rhodococcus]OZD39327.1 hypothetical protein CH252_30485 [Rhodococcus sp. 06-1477-1B]OZD53737.1 hypothetical protein CH266_04115 [Rhodococcus sp. 06-1474-1B]